MSEQDRLAQAVELVKAGNREEARSIVAQVLRQDSNNAEAWLIMAQLIEDPKRAIDCWKQVVRLKPDYEKAHQQIARLQEKITGTTSPISAQATHIAESKTATKQCPYCAETILANAIKCKHCGSDLRPASVIPDSNQPKSDNALTGLVGVSPSVAGDPIVSQTRAITQPILVWLRRLPAIGAAIVIWGFFLPWVMVSCTTMSGFGIPMAGYELASGDVKALDELRESSAFGSDSSEYVGGDSGPTEYSGRPLLWGILALGLLGTISLIGSRFGATASALLGVVGVIGMIIIGIDLGNAVREGGETGFRLEFQTGYFMTLFGFVWQLIVGILTTTIGNQPAAVPDATETGANQRRIKWSIIIPATLIILVITGTLVVFAIQPDIPRLSLIGSSPTPDATPTLTATATLLPAESCKEGVDDYRNELTPLLDEYLDSLDVAGNTSRIALSPVIQDLQRIRREVEAIAPPECAERAADLLVTGMDSMIKALLLFDAGASDEEVAEQLDTSSVQTSTALDQLDALRSGNPTPPIPTNTPRPTRTPFPTSAPTATLLPADSSIIVNNWEIHVDRVETVESFTTEYTLDTYKAAGRYAILYVIVTNKGLSPEYFTGIGITLIQDAEGRTYEEDSVTIIAEDILDIPIGAINPEETATRIIVFDISRSSAYYALIPGILADTSGWTLALNIP